MKGTVLDETVERDQANLLQLLKNKVSAQISDEIIHYNFSTYRNSVVCQ